MRDRRDILPGILINQNESDISIQTKPMNVDSVQATGYWCNLDVQPVIHLVPPRTSSN